jgi:ubiquitin C-terminal hydrolase
MSIESPINLKNNTEQIVSKEKQMQSEPKLGLCGFRNIGNTCYMNSILQLLIHSRLIVNFMLSKSNPYIDSETSDTMAEFETHLKQNVRERLGERERKRLGLDENIDININREQFENVVHNTLTIKLAEIINTIIYKGNSCITPSGFKQIVDKKIPSMRGMYQQDSHELLNGLLDNLIEETGNDSEPTINNVPQTIKEYFEHLQEVKEKLKNNPLMEDKKKIIKEFNEFKETHKKNTNKFIGLKYMTDVFKKKRTNSLDTSTTGYNPMIFNLLTFNVSMIKCTECENEISKYEYCTILSLPVKPTLKECFNEYVKEELVDRKCEVCGCKKAIKKQLIWRPGMTLFIQLCRFNNLPNGRTWKNNMDIEIPHQLDINEFCDVSMLTEQTPSYKYKLKGISNHMGGMGGGHYTADCVSITDNKTWYHFDDSSVSRHQGSEIDTSNAYILMYEMEQF